MTTTRPAFGYEVPCSPQLARLLGATFTNSYKGRNILHYWDGYLWWIS